MKQFNKWNIIKQETESNGKSKNVHSREVYLLKVGENVGFENCGKGENFLRPVLVYKRLSKSTFFGIPLSKTPKEGRGYFKFSFIKDIESTALLNQARVFDTRRVVTYKGKIGVNTFKEMSSELSNLLSIKIPPTEAGVGLGAPQAGQARIYKVYKSQRDKSTELVLIAHNIRSLWNIGTFFRNADCFGCNKIYLTGYTATPPRKEISKTAIGAEDWIEWEYQEDPVLLIKSLQEQGYKVVALEKNSESIDIETYKKPQKIALLLGHEVTGVPKEQLALCDDVVHIHQRGKKESLNVSVACGIALHELMK